MEGQNYIFHAQEWYHLVATSEAGSTALYINGCLAGNISEGRGVCCKVHADGCQNCGPLLGRLNTRCRVILRTKKGTIILGTTHVHGPVCQEFRDVGPLVEGRTVRSFTGLFLRVFNLAG